jgi:thioredoxin reductase (NADPH)
MILASELAGVPLFAGTPEADLIRLAAGSADMQLVAGQYAVHEGEPRALYVILDGETAVTMTRDGVEREIGRRDRGDFFGEVPIVFGTSFPAGLRTLGPARIMRIEPREFHVLAAAAPDVYSRLCASAREGLQGLAALAADVPAVDVNVVGHQWDDRCHTLRTFLDRNRVAYEWTSPDDPDIERLVPGFASLRGRYPAVALRGRSLLIRPGTRELAQRLGLSTVPEHTIYDTVIIGGGPAGLAAAVYGASEGLNTLMVEREAPGGQAGTSSRIENYLGFPTGVSGEELAGRALQQARRLGAEILVTRSVIGIDPRAREVELDGGEVVQARTIILAMGVAWRRLSVPGFERLAGRGIYYGASRGEARSVQGQDVYLIGAGNSAGQAAMHFANYARTVTLVCRGDSLAASMSHYLVEQLQTKANVATLLRHEITAVYGEDHLEALDLTDKAAGTTERRPASGLFVFIGADAAAEWLPPEIARDALGYIQTGLDAGASDAWREDRDPFALETSVPGIFACGDVRCRSVKRVASGVGEGSMVVSFVHQYLALAGVEA